jgi:hypothetical protein
VLQHRLAASQVSAIKQRHLASWLALQRNLRKTYITYAFLVIQLKNRFLSPVFEGLRAYVLTRRMRREARALDATKTKKKVFHGLKMRTMKSVQVCSAYDSLKKAKRTANLTQAYARWRSLFQEN